MHTYAHARAQIQIEFHTTLPSLIVESRVAFEAEACTLPGHWEKI